MSMALSTRISGFLSHEESGLETFFCTLDFFVGDIVGKSDNFVYENGNELRDEFRSCSGVDGEVTNIVVWTVRSSDGIDKTSFFADFLEESGRHASAEDLGDNGGSPMVFVGSCRRGESEGDMNLLRVAFFEFFASCVGSGYAWGRGYIFQVAHGVADDVDELLVFDFSAGGHNEVGGLVVGIDKSDEVILCHGGDAFFVAEDGVSEGLICECGILEVVEDEVVGSVLDHTDFLQDDASFFFYFFGVVKRVL